MTHTNALQRPTFRRKCTGFERPRIDARMQGRKHYGVVVAAANVRSGIVPNVVGAKLRASDFSCKEFLEAGDVWIWLGRWVMWKDDVGFQLHSIASIDI